MNNNSRIEEMKNIQNEGLELFKKKNQDYGDAFANYGVIGVLVRMGDKISRLQSITKKQISLINTESLRDTLIDLHNYSAMAIMLLDQDKIKRKDSEKTNYNEIKNLERKNSITNSNSLPSLTNLKQKQNQKQNQKQANVNNPRSLFSYEPYVNN